ncbi:MAG: hypothetical protein SFT92_02195 [Rickettsiales bacterium]|nr:hypothetical protein [Rickettsiales bacterium]
MHIIMLSTHRGCEDGFVVRRYELGKTYHVADGLASAFIRKGWAKRAPSDLFYSKHFHHKEIL